MSVQPEALAVRLLQEYLLRKLPAKVAEVNATLRATLKATVPGPYVVPDSGSGGSVLTLATNRDSDGTAVTLAAASWSTTDLAGEINAASLGITATADTDDRLVLTRTGTVTEGNPLCVVVKPATWLGVFGWDLGGEHNVKAALTAPSRKGITDGWHVSPPDSGRTFWIVIGDRDSSPVSPDGRRDETQVLLGLEVWVPDRLGNQVRSKENLASALRCIREVLQTAEGRVLGAASQGVVFVSIQRTRITGKAVALSDVQGVLFDVASLTVLVKIFESTA